MLSAADDVARDAYSRMNLSGDHKWNRHTDVEVEFILKNCGPLSRSSRILDLGCGVGRHAKGLAEKGIQVIAVDYVEGFIEKAKKESYHLPNPPQYILGDCREISPGKDYELVLCLYDVIGTYVEKHDNIRILKNIHHLLAPGGHALISVMNVELTEERAKWGFSLKENPDALLELAPSNTMESSGDIFNPDYFLLDRDTGVVYRREQFRKGKGLPSELIVRDKRFTIGEIEHLVQEVGLQVVWSRFVKAGQWDPGVARYDKHAKEILVLCERPLHDKRGEQMSLWCDI